MVQLKLFHSSSLLNSFLDFNSMMVQLKHMVISIIYLVMLNFNSMMVQLKRFSTLGNVFKQTFQFHDGTIKTMHRYYVQPLLQHFNSMMVQLKPIDIYNGNLVFTEVSLRINVYFFAVKMSMYNESIFADLRQHLHLIFIVKG